MGSLCAFLGGALSAVKAGSDNTVSVYRLVGDEI